MDELNALRSELNQAKDRILKIETYFKVTFAAAAIFGLTGAFGASILASIKSDIDILSAGKKRLAEHIEQLEKDALETIAESEGDSLERIYSVRDSTISTIDGEVSEKISSFLSNSEVVTLYKCPVGTGG